MNYRSEAERLKALDARNAREMGNAGEITADWPTAEDRREELRRRKRWEMDTARDDWNETGRHHG